MIRSQSCCSIKLDNEEANRDEECDEENAEDDEKMENKYSILLWPLSGKKRKPMVNFAAACVLLGTPEHCLHTIKKYQLSFKFVKTECKLVKNVLSAHGFKEHHPNSNQFNLMWTGTHLKPYTLRTLTENQKVNHFPRSYELTRKDRLYKNIQRMQHAKGVRHFNFIPQSYILPSELNEFYNAFMKDNGPWIVKPCASSRGRGIYLINNPNQIPLNDNVLVSKYINNPLLINGYKFDCRIYVAVTSFDPLRIYIYEEGLARFSTVQYEKNSKHLQNQMMHLTNYSINKISDEYVRCEDPELDDYGSKWSLSAMLRFIKEAGKDSQGLMAQIEDLIVKTLISGEMAIATACRMFVPCRLNCFELFGFDVLVDEDLKPWLLEVNLSPSLACDSPLDLKIKSNLVSDLFNLTGFVVDDTIQKKTFHPTTDGRTKQRHVSVATSSSEMKTVAAKTFGKHTNCLNGDERQLIRDTKEEFKRRGGFVRVFPSPESWQLYSTLQDYQTPYNRIVHSKLYPDLWRSSQRPQSATYIARARNFKARSNSFTVVSSHPLENDFYARYRQYERKLESWSNFDGTHHVHHSYNLAMKQKRNERPSEVQNADQASFDMNDIVLKGHCLTKLQAREAFVIYLQRVQFRLMHESSFHDDCNSYDEIKKQEQQIGLIQRFLRRAAINLSNPIHLLQPNRSLSVKERKNVLVHQLKEFVRVYSRETQLLMETSEDINGKSVANVNGISRDSFEMFLAISSEAELEKLLTHYTRHNKCASVFLGVSSGKSREDRSRQEATFLSKSPAAGTERDARLKSAACLNRPRSTKLKLEHSNGIEQLQRVDSFAKAPVLYAKRSNRPCSGALAHAQEYEHKRMLSSDSLIRASEKQKERMRDAVCIYAGVNSLLKTADSQTAKDQDPSLLRNSLHRGHTSELLHRSHSKKVFSPKEAQLYNQLRAELMRNDRIMERCLSSGDAKSDWTTETRRCREKESRPPVVKKQLSSHRISRFIGKR